ncbi:hypothetical protein [Paraburkholderia diazotrophica]|nr:hypothetical protein [Paraburkholderia diazotrophica]
MRCFEGFQGLKDEARNRERVRQLHGSVAFFSAPGSGFRISIRMPIDALE